MMESRSYRIASHVMRISLEGPWNFMEYTAPVRERIERAAAGLPCKDVLPVRAGDEEPCRTFVSSRKEITENCRKGMLDMSQYEPFRTDGNDEPLFTVLVHSSCPGDILEGATQIFYEHNELPFYRIHTRGGSSIVELIPSPDVVSAYIVIPEDRKTFDFYPTERFQAAETYGYATLYQLNTALMIAFAAATAPFKTLLIHASVIAMGGNAYLFFGQSGTGKSTHSRLWLENIKGTSLLNDDNPALRIEDGKVFVYGTPWSGKTPCYRNLSLPVKALVHLHQDKRNAVEKLPPLRGYVNINSSASCLRWNDADTDACISTSEEMAMIVNSYELGCLPDAEAALVCAWGVA